LEKVFNELAVKGGDRSRSRSLSRVPMDIPP